MKKFFLKILFSNSACGLVASTLRKNKCGEDSGFSEISEINLRSIDKLFAKSDRTRLITNALDMILSMVLISNTVS